MFYNSKRSIICIKKHNIHLNVLICYIFIIYCFNRILIKILELSTTVTFTSLDDLGLMKELMESNKKGQEEGDLPTDSCLPWALLRHSILSLSKYLLLRYLRSFTFNHLNFSFVIATSMTMLIYIIYNFCIRFRVNLKKIS